MFYCKQPWVCLCRGSWNFIGKKVKMKRKRGTKCCILRRCFVSTSHSTLFTRIITFRRGNDTSPCAQNYFFFVVVIFPLLSTLSHLHHACTFFRLCPGRLFSPSKNGAAKSRQCKRSAERNYGLMEGEQERKRKGRRRRVDYAAENWPDPRCRTLVLT